MGVNGSRWFPVVGAATMAFGLGGCATFEESGLPGSAASMAHNQMMFVREEPETFGHYRLTSLAKIKPDLDAFIRTRGMPDFLAETSNRGRNYYILYYLKDRQAFASRTRAGQGKGLEFAGPYPVTEKEFETLDGIRRQQSE
jgi:hypothetical protein